MAPALRSWSSVRSLASGPPRISGICFGPAVRSAARSAARSAVRSPLQPGHARRFHLASLVTVPVDAAEACISQLHAVSGTPWYLTIPLVALGVNLLVRLPFSIHARAQAQRRTQLAPLLQAWAAAHGKALHHERRASLTKAAAPAAAAAAVDMDAEVMKRYRRTARRIYARFGLQQWKLYGNLLAMPPWLVVIEAIRRMCGAPVGLLGLILRRTTGEGADATTDALAVLSEPSLATGGFLWCPDLTVADPYHILPFALSAMLLVNVLPGTDAGRRSLFGLDPVAGPGAPQISTETAAARALQRSLVVMSLSVGFVTMQFPSAIHLYWLSSAASSFLITHAVRRSMPLPEQDIRPSNKQDFPWVRPPRPEAEEAPKA